ncbi:TPA: hypothetical protein DCZ81_04260 [Candidatus Collierbacteria bacterium]|nr:hypothetical protein [Candidatus Collierbacteria bacterium]HCX25392.1 hypothetical protein [Candidatus Collierbacteria bacterium]
MNMSEKNKDFTKLYTPFMVVLLIAASFYIGRLSSQVDGLKKGGSGGDTIVPSDPAAAQAAPGDRNLDVASLKEKAKSLGLNADKFNSCLDGGTMAPRVATEQKEGSSVGVSGTPSFLINGILIVGAQPQSTFETIIDAELKNGGGPEAAKALGEAGTRNTLNLADSYVIGEKNAKIKMVEFTDFECPFCERAFPTVNAIMEKYKGKISLEYKSFPLSFHPLAQKAAEAALCAGEQGKFWEMHDGMFAPAQ